MKWDWEVSAAAFQFVLGLLLLLKEEQWLFGDLCQKKNINILTLPAYFSIRGQKLVEKQNSPIKNRLLLNFHQEINYYFCLYKRQL